MWWVVGYLPRISAVTDICQLSALVGVEPEHAKHLYTYLINKPQFSTPESRQALVRRLREALVKNVSVQGVCKPLESLFSIAKIERPEDKDYSFSRYGYTTGGYMVSNIFYRENWQSGPETIERGNRWLNTLYQANLSTPTTLFAAHKDFEYISRQISYGFYLSDHTILAPVETELVTLTGIMIQNLPLETAWHLRGTRRIGVSMEDVENVQQCVSRKLISILWSDSSRSRWWRGLEGRGWTKYHELRILSTKFRPHRGVFRLSALTAQTRDRDSYSGSSIDFCPPIIVEFFSLHSVSLIFVDPTKGNPCFSVRSFIPQLYSHFHMPEVTSTTVALSGGLLCSLFRV